jgi:hypothetical protein
VFLLDVCANIHVDPGELGRRTADLHRPSIEFVSKIALATRPIDRGIKRALSEPRWM